METANSVAEKLWWHLLDKSDEVEPGFVTIDQICEIRGRSRSAVREWLKKHESEIETRVFKLNIRGGLIPVKHYKPKAVDKCAKV